MLSWNLHVHDSFAEPLIERRRESIVVSAQEERRIDSLTGAR